MASAVLMHGLQGTGKSMVFKALAKIYGKAARKTGLSLLGSSVEHLNRGCLGHTPEICDGDAPHTARGCCAQAWGVSELLRVWLRITRTVP